MELGGAVVAKLLRDCCVERSPVAVVSADLAVLCRGTLVSVSEVGDTVSIDLAQEVSVRLLSTCFVHCVQKERGWMLASAVWDYTPRDAEHPPRLVLRVRSQMTGMELRQSARTPVVKDSGLRVDLICGDAAYAPRAVDISLGGMLVEFGKGVTPPFEVGSRASATLSWEGQRVEVAAEIQRIRGSACGLSFSPLAAGDTCLPEPYDRLVKGLEQAWSEYRRRAKAARAAKERPRPDGR